MQRVARLASLALGLSVVLAACGGASQSPAASATAGPNPLSMSEDVLSSASSDGPGWYDLVMVDLTDNPMQGPLIPGGFGDAEGTWVGRMVSTNWMVEVGGIYLGPDEVIEPLLSLDMSVVPYSEDGSDDEDSPPDPASSLSVWRAYLTTSDVKVGTGPEINGKSYDGTGIITDLTIGRNYITGRLELRMDRVLFWPEDEPQSIGVGGKFLAVRK